MNPEYPQDWLVEETYHAFENLQTGWHATAALANPIESVFLSGHFLRREPEETHADFIGRAIEWYGRIKREEDLRKIRIVWEAKELANAQCSNELHRVFPDRAWFEVKARPRQKNPVAMQVCWGRPTYGLFEVPFRIPKKSGPGHRYRTIPIPEIGLQVAPPQENP